MLHTMGGKVDTLSIVLSEFKLLQTLACVALSLSPLPHRAYKNESTGCEEFIKFAVYSACLRRSYCNHTCDFRRHHRHCASGLVGAQDVGAAIRQICVSHSGVVSSELA